jgi:DNA polymerase-3 subunit delta'
MSLPDWFAATWQSLAARMERRSLPHALLICGDAGLGKRELAFALKSAVLCEQRRPDGFACGKCRGCRLLAAGSHPDLVSVGIELRDDGKPRSEIIIEQIRALSQRLALSSQFGGLQVAVIDPADKMNHSAYNALLKTLEEPTASTVIVLVSDHPARLPATIRSRCQRVDAPLPTAQQAKAWLQANGAPLALVDQALLAALGNPGLAMQALRDDTLALREQCRNDLAQLGSGRRSALTIAEAWSADRPEERLWHAAALVRDECLALASSSRSAFGLTGAHEIPKLATWFAAANRSRELLQTQLRGELVLLDLLHAWQWPRST